MKKVFQGRSDLAPACKCDLNGGCPHKVNVSRSSATKNPVPEAKGCCLQGDHLEGLHL